MKINDLRKIRKYCEFLHFHILENIYLLITAILNKLLEALLLEYIGISQYEFYF